MFCSEYWFEEVLQAANVITDQTVKGLVSGAFQKMKGQAPVPGEIEGLGLTLLWCG
jgi:hypothetical protein